MGGLPMEPLADGRLVLTFFEDVEYFPILLDQSAGIIMGVGPGGLESRGPETFRPPRRKG